MTKPTRLHDLLTEALLHPDWSDLLRRGGGAQRSDVVRHVAGRIVLSRWPPTLGEVPTLGKSLNSGVAIAVRAHIQLLSPLIREAVMIQLAVVRTTCEITVAAGKPVTAARLSEPAASAVGALYAIKPVPDIDTTALARRIAERILEATEFLGPREFADAHLEEYRARWSTTGSSNLKNFPPSSIELGSDERPPFIPLTEETTWMLGTDRSVYSRYRLHFIATARSRSSPALDAGPPWADPHGSAHDEISRACEGFGLYEPAHQACLRSAASAAPDTAALGISEATRIWKEWRRESRAVEGAVTGVDADLIAACTAKMRLWLAYASPARDLVETFGPAEGFAHLISRAVVRKLWMGLHCQERETRHPANSGLINGLVATALDKSVPEAVRLWMSQPMPDPPSTTRINNTLAALAELPDLGFRYAMSMRTSDRAARDQVEAEYLTLMQARHHSHWSEYVLTPGELSGLLLAGGRNGEF